MSKVLISRDIRREWLNRALWLGEWERKKNWPDKTIISIFTIKQNTEFVIYIFVLRYTYTNHIMQIHKLPVYNNIYIYYSNTDITTLQFRLENRVQQVSIENKSSSELCEYNMCILTIILLQPILQKIHIYLYVPIN